MSNHTNSAAFVVAIPVQNERERIVGCLQALEAQTDVQPADLRILLFLNNCTDGTRALVEDWATRSSCCIRIEDCHSDTASAGWARRRAMEAAAAWLDEVCPEDGILLTTDADSAVPDDWITRNLAALRTGADAVAGRVAFDPRDIARFPAALLQRLEIERDYEALLTEIGARLDPHPGDPWPCHMTNSGASIAVRLAAFRRVGGMPSVSSGEDQAFIDCLLAHDLVVRHAPDIVVTTSGRLDGRARDGTADTLKRHTLALESPCVDRLERLSAFVLRLARRRFLPRTGHGLSHQAIAQRALRPSELPRQIRRARLLLSLLRWLEARRGGRRLAAASLPRCAPKQLSTP